MRFDTVTGMVQDLAGPSRRLFDDRADAEERRNRVDLG